MFKYFCGLDLGQQRDHSVFSVVEWRHDTHYVVRFLKRYNLKTPYPSLVQDVSFLLGCSRLAGRSILLLDATGARSVLDLFRMSSSKVVGITITGGTSVKQSRGEISVPKRELIIALQIVFQTKRIKLPRKLPHLDILLNEFVNFKSKISKTGHDSYEARGGKVHDDIVMSLSLPIWYGENSFVRSKRLKLIGGN